MEKIQNYLADHPEWVGVMFIIFGAVCLWGCIKDWHCLFGKVSPDTYSMNKIDGLINILGRKKARIVFGIISLICVLAGVVWAWIYSNQN